MAASKSITLKKFLTIDNVKEFASYFTELVQTDGTFSDARVGFVSLKDGKRLVKVAPYYVYDIEELGATKGLLDENDAEIAILKVLQTEFLDANVSPCIVKLENQTVITDLKHFVRDEDCFKHNRNRRVVRATPQNIITNSVCTWALAVDTKIKKNSMAIEIMEECDMSLTSFINSYRDTPADFIQLKSVLFMVIYTLYRIQKKYPGFRHNDLHTDNVMIKIDREFDWKHTKPRFLVFMDDGVKYTVPYFGYVPKIIDFGFSEIPELGIGSLMTRQADVLKLRPGNDILTLLHYVYGSTTASYYPRVIGLLSRIDPAGVYEYTVEVARGKVSDFRPAETIIRSSLWNEYRDAKVDASMVHAAYLG